MPQSNPESKAGRPGAQAVSKKDYLFLATLLGGRETVQRVFKKDPHGEALRAAADLYENREYVAAYECFKPAHDKVVTDMQRILTRNPEFEANRLATRERKPLAAAKEQVQRMKVHAQEVIDHFDRLLKDLQSKPVVRMSLKSRSSPSSAVTRPVEEAPPTTLNSASETRLDTPAGPLAEVTFGGHHFWKAAYSPPEKGSVYAVRDKAKGERVIRVVDKSSDGALVQVEILTVRKSSKPPIQLAVDSLARQAAKGWCSLLLPVTQNDKASAAGAATTTAVPDETIATMRLDIQNFSRCC